MIKMVLNDWIAGRKEAWNMALKNNDGFVLSFFANAMLWGGWLSLGENVSWEYRLLDLCEAVLFTIVVLLSQMYPNRLSKPMLLAPIEQEEKKRYLFTAFWLKQAIAIVPHLFLLGAGLWRKDWNLENAVLIFSVGFLWNVIMSLQNTKMGGTSPLFQVTWWICAINWMISLSAAATPFEARWECILRTVLYVIQMVMCIVLIKKEGKTYMEKAVNYELVYVTADTAK